MYAFNFLGLRIAVFFSLKRLKYLANVETHAATRNNPATRQVWFYPLFVRVTYPMASKQKEAKYA